MQFGPFFVTCPLPSPYTHAHTHTEFKKASSLGWYRSTSIWAPQKRRPNIAYLQSFHFCQTIEFCCYNVLHIIISVCRGRVNEESDKVDISDLTWEQREQVLKLLFFKMNHTPTPKNSKATPTTTLPSLHHLPNPPTGTRLATPPVFITQTNMPTSAGATPTAQRRVVSGQAS